MNNPMIGKCLAAVAALTTCATLTAADAPEVSQVTMSQDNTRLVTIGYTLKNAPAIVTVDIQTNCTAGGVETWASIGGQYIQGLQGAVNKKITEDDTYSITWRPDLSWNGHKVTNKGARAVVKAWSLDNPPDIMVVDLAENAAERTLFYPDASFVPGGIPENDVYRTSMMVFRKIHARGIPWTMGPVTVNSVKKYYNVTLDSDYYIGIYEITQGQAAMVGGPTYASSFKVEGVRRPIETSSFREIRNSSGNNSDETLYPQDPAAGSLIGRFRALTGQLVDFDLPSEAQWEYACRAGHGEGYWGNGKTVGGGDTDNNLPGRYAWNTQHPGSTIADAAPADDDTNIVGSYEPNSWGIYDMHGNVNEMCLDWWAADPDAAAPDGAYTGLVNANGTKYANGTEAPNKWFVLRSGGYNSSAPGCKSESRNYDGTSGHTKHVGVRLVCPAVVK